MGGLRLGISFLLYSSSLCIATINTYVFEQIILENSSEKQAKLLGRPNALT